MSIGVLVVDDSQVIRDFLSLIINDSPDLKVIGTAPDAASARHLIKTLRPDVLTLDVHMPGMDGIDFLTRLMKLNPMPVVMVSSFTKEGSQTTLKALELGAVDFASKPLLKNPQSWENYAQTLRDKIRAAHSAKIRFLNTNEKTAQTFQTNGVDESKFQFNPNAIIALGASTGGPEAIKTFLEQMPKNCPPILIVQHMPEHFTNAFAARLNRIVAPEVVESQGKEALAFGKVFVAPGNAHLFVPRAARHTALSNTAPVCKQRPSADVLFSSLTDKAKNVVAVLLTGMGKDGAAGLLKLRQAGAHTLAQDQKSALVYGMPREAFELGAVEELGNPFELAQKALAFCAV